MNQEELVDLLNVKHESLSDYLITHQDSKWNEGPPGKWKTNEHVLHLIQSIQPLRKALTIPKFVLRYKFGKSNRSLRTMDQVINKYKTKLSQNPGVVSPLSVDMDRATAQSKKELIADFQSEKNKLVTKVEKWTDSHLEQYILPHPLMGRMPIKELLMWTAYHAEHHHNIIKTQH